MTTGGRSGESKQLPGRIDGRNCLFLRPPAIIIKLIGVDINYLVIFLLSLVFFSAL